MFTGGYRKFKQIYNLSIPYYNSNSHIRLKQGLKPKLSANENTLLLKTSA